MAANTPAVPFASRRHPHLYEINTWVWLEELSRAARRRITLGGVPDAEWDRLRQLGFDFVWLMGVWQRSPAGRQISRSDPGLFPHYDAALPGWRMADVVGSPYAVQAYCPDPRIGTWEELDGVRRKLRARGLGLILDFVTNHTAPDHDWLRSHPEYFVQGKLEDYRRNPGAFLLVEPSGGDPLFIARGRDPFFPPWPDTAQLDYFSPATRRAVLAELKEIARHCDGVRCDMAMLVLHDVFAQTWGALRDPRVPAEEFWTQAVASLPGLLWIAEVYWDLEWRMQQLGFQFTYDKRLLDRLHGAPPEEVRAHLRADGRYQERLVRFLENHDEPRSAAVFGKARLPAVATLVATLPGMRFYHHGQLEGRTIRPPMQLAAAAAEPPDPQLAALYQTLLRISDARVFHDGAWRLLEAQAAGDATFANLVAYEWTWQGDWKIVVVNLGRDAAQGWLPLGERAQAASRYDFWDEFHDLHYERLRRDLQPQGLFVRLDAGDAHIFSVRPL